MGKTFPELEFGDLSLSPDAGLGRLSSSDDVEESDFERVSRNGCALKSIPENERTNDLCLAAVRENGLALASVPKAKRTYEICLEACRNDGNAVYYVPARYRSRELCLAAVENAPAALRFMKKNQINADICLSAVSANGLVLEYVPQNMRVFDICIAAVKNDSRAIKFVPDYLIDSCLARVLDSQKREAGNDFPDHGAAAAVVPVPSTCSMKTADIYAAAWNLKRHILRERMRLWRRKAFRKAVSRYLQYPYGCAELLRLKWLADCEWAVGELEIRRELQRFARDEGSWWKWVFAPNVDALRSSEYRRVCLLIAAAHSRCGSMTLSLEDVAMLDGYWPWQPALTDGAVAAGTKAALLRTQPFQDHDAEDK